MIWSPLSDAAAAGGSPASVAASRQLPLPSLHSWQMLLRSCFELSNAKVAMRKWFPSFGLSFSFSVISLEYFCREKSKYLRGVGFSCCPVMPGACDGV